MGCVGDAVGELAAYLALGIAVGIGAGLVALLVAVADALPVVGAVLISLVVALYVYGVVWTVRVRPGLYLEYITGELRTETRASRIGRGRSRRFRLVAMAWTQFATIAVAGFGFFWILFYRD